MARTPVLTEQQIKFATLLVYEAGRKSPAECAFEAGYKTRPRQSASELRNPKVYPLVAAHIRELRQEAQEKYGINYQSHLQEMARLHHQASTTLSEQPWAVSTRQCSCAERALLRRSRAVSAQVLRRARKKRKILYNILYNNIIYYSIL